MKEIIVRIPDIIAAAATSSRGVVSLMVIVFAMVAYLFFRHSKDVWKFASLALLFIGCVGFGFTAYREAARESRTRDAQEHQRGAGMGSAAEASLEGCLERWIAEAEAALAAMTVSRSSPLPIDLVAARSAFETAWRQAALPAKKRLDPVGAAKGLGYLTRLYRLAEADSPSQTNAMAWADEAIRFAEEIQNRTLLTDALLDKAAIYLDLAQLAHTDKSRFEQVAKAGDALMARAYQTANQEQRPEVLRMTSRFYYNLSRPQSFRLSDAWDNNYLMLAYQKALEAVRLDSSSLKNANQLARAVIKASKNPPQDRDPEWTKRLRSTKDAFKRAWDANEDDLRTVAARISPLDVLGVVTLETVSREWSDAANDQRRSIARQLLSELDADSLGPLREAAALLENSELRTSYGFDLHYDIARSLAVKTGILSILSPDDASAIFVEVIRNLELAREAARTPQVEAALKDFDREITFSFLSAEQRTTLARLMSIPHES